LETLRDRIRLVPDIHAPEVLEHVRALAPDLGLIYGSPILRPDLFGIPALGTLGIHHGTVPRYRGKKTTFWEMYYGEPQAGVTIQRVGAGLDTGDVVEQGAVTVGARSRRRVWAELEALGVDLYVRAILKVREGTAQPIPQSGPRYALCRDPSFRHLAGLWWRQLNAALGRPLPRGSGPAMLAPRRSGPGG
jgi:methionyl-tRNA formyltransferase